MKNFDGIEKPKATDDVSVVGEGAPEVSSIRRRMLLKGAISVAPVILTLRASPSLASTGNCQVVEMTPRFDPTAQNLGGDLGAWSFSPSDRTPWLGPNGDGVACVETDVNQCPTAVVGYFDTTKKDPNYRCQSGIVIAASSGGSFTH